MSKLDDILAPLPFEEIQVSYPNGESYITTTADDAKEQIIAHMLELIEEAKQKGTPLHWLTKQVTEL